MTKKEIKKRIEQLKKEKNVVILAHYYTTKDVQEIADFLGDSLALSVKARDINAPIILFAGVNFIKNEFIVTFMANGVVYEVLDFAP